MGVFLELLKKQKDDLRAKIERERKARRMPDLSENIFNLANDHGRPRLASQKSGSAPPRPDYPGPRRSG
jgi:hypothetical protein